ncbi:MAG: peptidylprolyl isomerase [Verrucomicrobiaceae bacterium]|nr:peptidylprolyl isomerase [Verrucomicrobiaceae bacterium]
MKTLLLIPLLWTALTGMLAAQALPAPDSIRAVPETTLPSSVDKLAQDAQKSVFDAVEGTGVVKGAPSQPLPPAAAGPAPIITTRPGGGTRATFSRPPMPPLDEPAFWSRDSVHKLAVMEVKLGSNVESVIIELFTDDAPQTVANFVDRCESKAYDGLAFHRAIENFLVQTGDPLTADEERRDEWGTGGEDASLPAEIKRKHRVGAVAMARRGNSVNPSKRSNGSQFYISLGNFSSLDGQYTVFGQVIDGLDLLQHISRMPVDSNDCPVARIEIKSLRIVDQKGPLITRARSGNDKQRGFRSTGSKGWVDRFLERVW